MTEEDDEWLKISKDLEKRGYGVVHGKEATLAKIKEIADSNPISHTIRRGALADD